MWTSLGNPTPRAQVHTYRPVTWPVGSSLPLPTPHCITMPTLDVATASRRSEREFAAPSDATLGALFWHTARPMRCVPSPMGFEIEQRPVPSAGAIHPIHLILQLPDEAGWGLYQPAQHRLAVLENVRETLRPLVEQCEGIVPRGGGRLMLFVAEPGKTAAKYENAESLVWRDAGVLQGALALTAAALEMNFCLLGITGNPWIARLAEEGKLMGVGAAILGARP